MKQTVFFFKINDILKLFVILLVTLGLLLVAAPGWSQETGELRIGVMPFIKGKNPKNIEDAFSCPYSSFCFENDSIRDGADQALTRILQTTLIRDFNGAVIPLERAEKAFDVLKIDHAKDSPEAVIMRLGEILNADYMAGGNVWRYKERVGTSFSAQSPASVAFTVYLVDMKTRKLIWTGTYDQTQQALTENLLNAKDFFKQGGKWLTADDLARFGMNKIFQNFPLK